MNKDEVIKHGYQIIENDSARIAAKQDKIDAIKAILPEAVNADGIVNLEALQDALGSEAIDAGNRGYELQFAGKGLARAEIGRQTDCELKIDSAQSKEFNDTENVIIRGDNLDVLKILQHNYSGKIKMIYIDPPYNTGSDGFVYNDNFKKNEAELIEELGLHDDMVDYLHNLYGTRTHSGWLSFIYPRLKLARELLTDDGVIFISIDDNEQAPLKLICDEIFGEENFEGHIHWRRRHNQPNDATKMIGLVAEHIFSYTKNKQEYKKSGVGKISLTGDFSNPDNDSRGEWASKPWKVGSDQSGSKYNISLPSGRIVEEDWMGEKSTFEKLLSDNRIIFTNSGDGLPRKKYFKFEREKEGQCATNWWSHEQFGHNQEGNDILTELMNNIKNTFSNPKPVRLISSLISIANCRNNDLILDFFAGSGTTADAVMQMNAEDGGNRKFILVQWDEAIKQDTEAYKFCKANQLEPLISSICIERVNRAGEKLKQQQNNKQPDLLQQPASSLDIGYKVFSLQKRPMITMQGNLNINRITVEDTLYNMLAQTGKPLHLPVTRIEQGMLYMVDDCYYLLAKCAHDIASITDQQIYIDGYADIDITSWLNYFGLNKTNVRVTY